MRPPSVITILLASLFAAVHCASAAETRQRSAWKIEGAAELSAGFGAIEFSDGWETGGLLVGKGDLALVFQPSSAFRLLTGAIAEAEYGNTSEFARAGGRLAASMSPVRTWNVRTEISGFASEGADPFRDSLRARARISTDLDIVPALFIVSAGYGIESDDFYRIGTYEMRQRVHAEAAWIPSVSPLFLVQAGVFGETLAAVVEGDRRSSPGGTIAVDLEILEGFALSFSGEYRYDIYESGARAHAIILGVRFRARIVDNLFFFVEYGLDSNMSSAGSESFYSQRICAGFRVTS